MKSKTIISIVLILAMALGFIGCTKAPAVTYQTPFPEEGTVGGVEYYITPDTSYFRTSKTAGYYIDTLDQPDAPYIYFITSGEKKTSGYGVNIVNIEVDDQNRMTVTVEFTEPQDKNVTKGKTYPTTALNILPPYVDDVTIQLTNGDLLKYLED